MIADLRISNYKSIGQLKLSCSRINIFIGEPNTGKSNILEAINLNYLSWLLNSNDLENAIAIAKDIFRVDDVKSLFKDYNDKETIRVEFVRQNRLQGVSLQKDINNNYIWDVINSPGEMPITNDFSPLEHGRFGGGGIRPYYFKPKIDFNNEGNYSALKPPYGSNIIHVLESNASLRSQFDQVFSEFGYKIRLDRKNETLSITREETDGFVFSVPFKAISDTLKRLMFYITAIRSNNGENLTFQEPEVHSFPPYVSFLADEIIEATDNQFFIITHSPYLLNHLIEKTPKNELKVFVCGYNKNKYETIAKELSANDLSELLDYGVDIFFNINRYLDDRVEHSS